MASNADMKTTATTTGDIDGASAGTVTAGPSFFMRLARPESLGARCVLLAETDTLTLSIVWEVSQDQTTWERALQPNAAAEVVIATGTGGADAAVTRVISAPAACYGYRFARASVLNGAATGTTSDTFSIRYNYQVDRGR